MALLSLGLKPALLLRRLNHKPEAGGNAAACLGMFLSQPPVWVDSNTEVSVWAGHPYGASPRPLGALLIGSSNSNGDCSKDSHPRTSHQGQNLACAEGMASQGWAADGIPQRVSFRRPCI